MSENYGIRVAKPGYDYRDPDRYMSFVSNREGQRISDVVNVLSPFISAGVDSYETYVTHNKGFTPQFIAIVGDDVCPTDYVEFAVNAYATPTRVYAKMKYNPGYVPSDVWRVKITIIILENKIK